jgi:hypothetical protein
MWKNAIDAGCWYSRLRYLHGFAVRARLQLREQRGLHQPELRQLSADLRFGSAGRGLRSGRDDAGLWNDHVHGASGCRLRLLRE